MRSPSFQLFSCSSGDLNTFPLYEYHFPKVAVLFSRFTLLLFSLPHWQCCSPIPPTHDQFLILRPLFSRVSSDYTCCWFPLGQKHLVHFLNYLELSEIPQPFLPSCLSHRYPTCNLINLFCNSFLVYPSSTHLEDPAVTAEDISQAYPPFSSS